MNIGTTLTIRPIATQDEGQWRSLWCACSTFYDMVLPGDTNPKTFHRITAGGINHAGRMMCDRAGVKAPFIVHERVT